MHLLQQSGECGSVSVADCAVLRLEVMCDGAPIFEDACEGIKGLPNAGISRRHEVSSQLRQPWALGVLLHCQTSSETPLKT